ncbi:MAG TPA: long-chain fatty acid--CoA ligase [Anaerolineae bacterium]
MSTKPWLKFYDEGVPATLQPYPERTLLDVVSDTVRQRPDHPALIFKGNVLSYAGLERLSHALAAALVAEGVQKGDRVAILLPNTPQALICQIGIWKAGAVATMINPLYTEPELVHALNECGAATAVVLTPFYDKVKAVQAQTNVRRVIATNVKEYLSPFLRLLFTLLKERKEGHRIALRPDDLWLSALLRQYDGRRPGVTIDPDDPALLLFTGGTSGTPKAAVASHRGLLAAGLQLHAWFGSVLTQWQDVLLAAMPLFHVYGNVGVVSVGLVGHNPLALVPHPRDLDDLIGTVRKVKPAFLPGVPTLFIALLNHPQVQAGKVDFKSMKLCISGAAPLLAETKKRFESLTGGTMVEGYALTESMMAAVIGPVHGVYKEGAVGIPLPDVEVRIVDSIEGTELPACEVGEILIRAPQLMVEYWQRPEETAQTIREGWLYTGDLGYLDEDGYVFIVDRKKDLIKPSGFQVWPREVEEVIASHPAVNEVGVAGIPDAYQGEAVKAWVLLNEGHQVTAEEIRAYCRQRLAAYKVPKQVEFVDELPKSTVGKVLRRLLVEEDLAGEPAITGEKLPVNVQQVH